MPRQPTIQAQPQFYGHLVGLSLERGDLGYSKEYPGKMYARFEYQDQSTTYVVPDWELFTLLSSHLCDNARVRAQLGNYGFAKLWIEKTSAGWAVTAPPDEVGGA
jgi:hypothetical protein